MYNIALAGNPNTGKSTTFNALTKMQQHTGNWAGKTVDKSTGKFLYHNQEYQVVDLPGTYSLLTKSDEESVARDYICSGLPDVIIVVVDATALQRNLNLLFQIMEMEENVILAVNLLDEAKKQNIHIDLDLLASILRIPVIGTSARDKVGIEDLKEAIEKSCMLKSFNQSFQIQYPKDLEKKIQEKEEFLTIENPKLKRWVSLKLVLGEQSAADQMIDMGYSIPIKADPVDDNAVECVVETLMETSRNICKQVVHVAAKSRPSRKVDKILTSKVLGIPIMIALLALVFYLTISGANLPSSMLANLFTNIEEKLLVLFGILHIPETITNLIISGFFRTLAWVVAVMLPPMAIFFPMFAILEDWGYLPRIAFNLDTFFKRVGSTGKQSLTMAMGFGCNAAAIASSKIISSPKERIAAIVTNNFMPCNGRFPTIIMVSMLFVGGLFYHHQSLIAALVVAFAIIFQFFVTALITKFLTSTSLKHLPSTITLELPPYRRPQFLRLIIRATIDKTLKILWRAVKVAAPAGVIIWILTHTTVGDLTLFTHAVKFLDPLGHLMGLDGTILMGFILGLPANEIVMPIIIMGYLQQGALLELDSIAAVGDLFRNNGWTIITAINVILFSLNHYPCGTTLYSIKKETNSAKWTLLSFAIPTSVGMILTIFVAQVTKIFL